jgi:hypothetical protein
VKEHLAGPGGRYVAAFGAAEFDQGGDALTVVALNLGENPGRWRWMPVALLSAGLLIVKIAPLRSWFSLETQTRGGGFTILIAAAAGSALIAAIDLAVRRRHNSGI